MEFKDILTSTEKEFWSHPNKEGIVFGLDTKKDELLVLDKNVFNSVLIYGFPRMGKSTYLRTVLFQLYLDYIMKKEKFEIHVFDPKGSISDFCFIDLKHIVEVKSDINEFNAFLDNLMTLDIKTKQIVIIEEFVSILCGVNILERRRIENKLKKLKEKGLTLIVCCHKKILGNNFFDISIEAIERGTVLFKSKYVDDDITLKVPLIVDKDNNADEYLAIMHKLDDLDK